MRDGSAGPVIYLIGTAGHPNYGDEVITAGWLRYLARTQPDAEVWLDTPRPGQSAVLLDGLHPGLRCVDTLFHGCWNAPEGAGPEEIIAHGRRVVAEPGLIPREATGVENLSRVDLVHVLGGGYINAIWPQHLALLGAAAEIGERYGARLAMTGAGLTPLPEDTGPLGSILSGFDIVDLRDEESLAAISDLVPHATHLGDDAFLATGNHLFDRSPGARTVLCLQSDLLQVPLEEITDYVVRTLQAWGVDQERVTLVECLPPDDAKALALLQPHLPQIDLLPFSFLWRNGLPYAPSGQRWISTRFHPHLVAAAGGVWGVAIPISPGYLVKHSSLTRLGSGWAVAPDLGEPLEAGRIPGRPFDGRLAELKAEKEALAQRVTALLGR